MINDVTIGEKPGRRSSDIFGRKLFYAVVLEYQMFCRDINHIQSTLLMRENLQIIYQLISLSLETILSSAHSDYRFKEIELFFNFDHC